VQGIVGEYFARHLPGNQDKQNDISGRSRQPGAVHPIGTRVRFQQGEVSQHTGFVCGWSVSEQVGWLQADRGHMSGTVTNTLEAWPFKSRP